MSLRVILTPVQFHNELITYGWGKSLVKLSVRLHAKDNYDLKYEKSTDMHMYI